MYYLDFHQLYKTTTVTSRIDVRKQLNRNEVMTRRLKLQRNKCFWCGVNIDMTAHLDHIIPVYYGGTNRPVNMVAACKLCNLTKMTDQIEITNVYTIQGYIRLQEAHAKYLKKYKAANDIKRRYMKRYVPKKVQLYKVYRADLFKHIGKVRIVTT